MYFIDVHWAPLNAKPRVNKKSTREANSQPPLSPYFTKSLFLARNFHQVSNAMNKTKLRLRQIIWKRRRSRMHILFHFQSTQTSQLQECWIHEPNIIQSLLLKHSLPLPYHWHPTEKLEHSWPNVRIEWPLGNNKSFRASNASFPFVTYYKKYFLRSQSLQSLLDGLRKQTTISLKAVLENHIEKKRHVLQLRILKRRSFRPVQWNVHLLRNGNVMTKSFYWRGNVLYPIGTVAECSFLKR